MWIEKRGDAFRAYERYTDLNGKVHRISVKMPRDTAQCRNKASKQLGQMLENIASPAAGLTLRQLCDYYIVMNSSRLKPSTTRRNKYACDAFVRIFGNVKVQDLTAGYIKKRLLDYTNKPTTINEYLQRFKELLKWGYRNDLVDDISYLDKITKVKDTEKKIKLSEKFLESDECSKLLNAMDDPWRRLAQFMILSGLRVGECLALDESDLNFKKREISVTKSKDSTDGAISTTKTAASTRQVYMQDDLYRLCKDIIKYNQSHPHILYIDRKPLFYDKNGTSADYRAFLKHLEDVSEKTIGRKINSHTLRHTHASLLAENGVSYDVIARRLGHTNSRITRQIYIHVTEKRKELDKGVLKEVKLI